MAKYIITHCCGHDETVTLFGSSKERQSRIEWLESQPCAECRAKDGNGMTGSAKQIAWAVDIRNDMVNRIETKFKDAMSTDGATEDQLALISANHDAMVKGIESIKDAKWFIDHRSTYDRELFRELFEIGKEA